MHGIRESENGEFKLTSSDVIFFNSLFFQKSFSQYGRTYLGTVIPNFLGTKFEVYDYGIEAGYILKDLPKDFFVPRKLLATIEYDSNFFAEKPRSFRISIFENK